MSNTRTRPARITESVAKKVYATFVRHYQILGHDIRILPVLEQGDGDPAWHDYSPKLVRNLEESGTFGIAWEEGDYEWPFDEIIFNMADKHGVMIEPMNGWAVGIYPA